MGALLIDSGPLFLLAVFLLLGLVTGIPAGMFGIGGGLVLVPALVWLFTWMGFDSQFVVQAAIGTSLGAIVPTAMASARGHCLKGGVHVPSVRRLLLPIVVGATLGAWLAIQIDGRALARIFGVFEIAIALWLLAAVRPPTRPEAGRAVWFAAGTGIGAVSALIGIAGGTLTTPFLLRQGRAIRQAIGSAAALGIPIAIAGSLVYLLPALLDPALEAPAWSLGYLYLPAVAGIALGAAISVRGGVWLAHHLPVLMLRRAFAGVLMLAGLYMLLR
ncbi:Protein of unknown function DUF81 [Thioalkalivibrio nitratireducens DSM 14787]|uniref:Probable membrane transporter protein n=1 Tax=Thioalkalivibrio nitratireducens (strain DSM 14787 / UNIQEM 213 / ALEN2) TaxID=1255043 RepID=L0E377_THIND|nr:sulfite exporter TauE/SafE family protein [Thioalkalivibrio nitratireducens]AGA35091.1 Protein of unknown function DUF81 [Thioalkalivibrio nitratireducens DSM 14787]